MSTPASTFLRNMLLITATYFFWGFVAASNSILIGFSKHYFQLTQEVSQFLDTSFYGAYFYGSLGLYLVSYYTRKNYVLIWGYRRAFIIGLTVCFLGASLLAGLIAWGGVEFWMILVPFFVVALGFSLLQLVANPLVIIIGNPDKGAYRLSFAGGVNSLGTLIGPLILGKLLFPQDTIDNIAASIQELQHLYIALSLAFLLLALGMFSLRLPKDIAHPQVIKMDADTSLGTLLHAKYLTRLMIFIALISPFVFVGEPITRYFSIPALSFPTALVLAFVCAIGFGFLWTQKRGSKGWGIFAYPQVPLSMLAIFFYVGTEVSIPSNFNVLFSERTWQGAGIEGVPFLNVSKSAIALFWGSLLVGRWIGAVEVITHIGRMARIGVYLLVGTAAFFVVYGAHYLTFYNEIQAHNLAPLSLYYLVLILFFSLLVYAMRSSPARLLLLLSCTGILSLLVGMHTQGYFAYYAFIATGLSCAMMWPGIFSLAIRDMGANTTQVSTLLIMMILGGALIPPMQGSITDIPLHFLGYNEIRLSYFVPVLGFLYQFLFAAYFLWGMKKQN